MRNWIVFHYPGRFSRCVPVRGAAIWMGKIHYVVQETTSAVSAEVAVRMVSSSSLPRIIPD